MPITYQTKLKHQIQEANEELLDVLLRERDRTETITQRPKTKTGNNGKGKKTARSNHSLSFGQKGTIGL